MPDPADLLALEAAVARDLEKVAWPADPWVKRRAGPDGRPMLNVLIIGAGQGGLTLGHQLQRERVDGVMIVDPGRSAAERGPWKTYGRMKTLRSPKETNGPDLGVPSLAFQSWFEAQFGRAAWEALGKIPKEQWADYLDWLERVLALPVRSGVTATAIRPSPTGVAVDLDGAGGAETRYARQVVIATGIETPGRWWAPPVVAALPPGRWSHTGEAIDFAALAGKSVAVLGAGASAFDNAATALEAGAAEVRIFFRRPALQRIQPYKQISYVGFLRHLGDLDDATRWRFLKHLLTLREAFPAETWARVTAWPNAHLHAGAGWRAARVGADGRIALETEAGAFVCDHVIAGTGFDMDLEARPELADIAGRAALWADRYTPPAGEGDDRLARYPYLGPSFEFMPKSADLATAAADAAALARVRLFTFGATMSFGPSGSSINALKFAAPRLVGGLTGALFEEDADAHYADLRAYDIAEF